MWREDDRGEDDGHKQYRISQDSPMCKHWQTKTSRFSRKLEPTQNKPLLKLSIVHINYTNSLHRRRSSSRARARSSMSSSSFFCHLCHTMSSPAASYTSLYVGRLMRIFSRSSTIEAVLSSATRAHLKIRGHQSPCMPTNCLTHAPSQEYWSRIFLRLRHPFRRVRHNICVDIIPPPSDSSPVGLHTGLVWAAQ